MRRVLDAAARPLHLLYTACGALAAVALAALAALVLASIVTRLFGTQIMGVTSYATYMLAASWFLAMAYTFSRGEHIRVKLLIGNFTGRKRQWAEAWCLAVGLGVSALVAYYAYDLAYTSYLIRERSEGPDGTLLWIPQLSMVAGAAVMTIGFLERLLRLAFMGEVEPDPPDELAAAETETETGTGPS